MINPAYFPRFWIDFGLTVEIKAKAKELAIRQLQTDLVRGQAEVM